MSQAPMTEKSPAFVHQDAPAYVDPSTTNATYVGSQPKASTGMSLDPLNPLALPKDEQGQRDFNVGCADAIGKNPGFCILACCAPCVTFGSNKTKYDALKANHIATDDGYIGGNCCVFYLLGCVGVSCILDMFLRTDLRERASIKGSGGSDFLMSCCCLPCSQTQQHEEIVAEEKARQNLV